MNYPTLLRRGRDKLNCKLWGHRIPKVYRYP